MGFFRFFLTLVVVITHTEPLFGFTFINGEMAVKGFYMISGFYMTLVLNEKYIGPNKSYKLFITNRLMRIYPMYWVVISVMVISSLAYGFISNGTNYGILNPYVDNFDLLQPTTLIILIFSNIFIFFQDLLVFVEIDQITGLLKFQPHFGKDYLKGHHFAIIFPVWTIGLELLYYLVAPFIVRKKNSIVIACIILSLLIDYLIRYEIGLRYISWNLRFFPNELCFFLYGTLAYRLYKNKTYLSWNYLYYISGVLLLIMSLTYPLIDFGLKYVSYFLVLFIVMPFLFEQTKNNKLDRYIGDLIYPVYICHMFIIITVSSTGLFIYNKGITVIITSIITAIGLKYFINDKVENYRQKRLKKTPLSFKK